MGMTHTLNGDLINFKAVEEAPITSLKCSFLPYQTGSRIPSPENVRSIQGWNTIKAFHTASYIDLTPSNFTTEALDGANFNYLGNNTFELDNTLNTGAAITLSVSFTFKKDTTYNFILVRSPDNEMKDGTTDFGIQFKAGNTKALLMRPNGAWNNNIFSDSYTFSADYNVDTLIFGITAGNGRFKVKVIMTEDPIQTTTINLEEPCYGGYIDLITGNIVKTVHKSILNENTVINSIRNETTAIRATINDGAYGPSPCDNMVQLFSYMNLGNTAGTTWYAYISAMNSNLYIRFSTQYNTEALISQYLRDHPLEIAYNVNETIIGQIDPITLKTLRNSNIIWTSTNDITELTYEFNDSADIIETKKRIAINTPHIASANGSVPVFNTDMPIPLKECKVNFSPKQDYNLYGNVWLGGYGKNKLGFTEAADVANGTNKTATFTNNYITLNASAAVTGNAIIAYNTMVDYCKTTNLPAGTYTFSIQNFSTNIPDISKENMRIIFGWTSALDGETFTLEEDGDAVALNYTSVFTWPADGYIKFRLQIEQGESVTTWEPYENLSPIRGWDRINLWKSNDAEFLLPETSNDMTVSNLILHNIGPGKYEFINNGVDASTSVWPYDLPRTFILKDAEWNCFFNSSLKKSLGTYDLIASLRSNNSAQINLMGAYGAGGDDFFIINIDNSTKVGVAIDEIRLVVTSNFIGTTLQPIMCDTYSTTNIIPTETVYGGYIDFISGDLVQTHKYVLLNDSSKWTTFQSNGYLYDQEFTDRLTGSNANIICSISANINQTTSRDWNIRWNLKDGYNPCLKFNANVAHPSLTEIQTLATNNQIAICYPLAEPIHTQLTAQAISAFKGKNHLWSNTNDSIEIKYWTH